MFDHTQHSGHYHASYQHGITFNFWLHTYPIFKHQLPIHPWIYIFHPTIIIKQPSSHSHQSICPIQMTSSPYSRTPLTFKWKISPSPNVPSSWNSPYNHSSLLDQLFNVSSAPSWHSLLFLSLLLWHPLWFLSLHWMILLSLLSVLTTHYFLHVYDPRDHIIWERKSLQSGGEHTLSG